MNSGKKLKEQIIDRVRALNTEDLRSVDAFIATLETKQRTVQEILSFAGAWKDLEEEVFLDLTENLPAQRKKGEGRIL